MHPLHSQISSALQSRQQLSVNGEWLNEFLDSRGPNPPPLPALISTAQFRILTSDITTSLSPSSTGLFPRDVADVNVKARQLPGTVVVQILDVLDVGSSKWSQVEAIERVERGEEVRGREVIRTVDANGEEEGPDPTATAASHASATGPTATADGSVTNKKLTAGPHRLVIQDARGTKAMAFELEKIPKVGISISASVPSPAAHGDQAFRPSNQDDIGMYIGCKLVLKPGTVVRRGIVMLKPENCVVLGGKVEAWDTKWKEERKQTLNTLLVNEHDAGA
ncbi:hypothetical protein PV05_09331 [Exophiala xenobiotica]|uniref:RecQ-mediated genome instability protein 1 n=1 Tax=Exophiala xenobiotica TaxID=348802 RepID=A0A0D2E547_9EURO|nr:uncharacterized protein PV05_09331 [Exophiala xenobiotica]KIW50528.1 hypothetical protein PV05_09331 [Exophiala xenobiotica]